MLELAFVTSQPAPITPASFPRVARNIFVFEDDAGNANFDNNLLLA